MTARVSEVAAALTGLAGMLLLGLSIGGCQADPVLGNWVVDAEQTVETAQAVPECYRRQHPTLSAYREHLWRTYSGATFAFERFAEGEAPASLEGAEGRVRSAEGAGYVGAWRRDPGHSCRCHVFKRLSRNVYEDDGLLDFAGGAAIWRTGCDCTRETLVLRRKR
jgi:hypothetical protein